jgi:hypothetical protein
MTGGFKTVLSASAKDRRDLFVSTGGRMGTVEQNIEKDFWVCWTLDALFNGLQPGGPRLLFKGGTSLSKGFGLIERFSEDIDITVFREDIGEPAARASGRSSFASGVQTTGSVTVSLNRPALTCCHGMTSEGFWS